MTEGHINEQILPDIMMQNIVPWVFNNPDVRGYTHKTVYHAAWHCHMEIKGDSLVSLCSLQMEIDGQQYNAQWQCWLQTLGSQPWV